MTEFMEIIFRGLPYKYKKLGDSLTERQFSELMMLLISLKFRHIVLSEEIDVEVSGGKNIVVTGDILRLANELATEIIFYLGKYGTNPRLIIKDIAEES
ncbi:MAG: hypothetical protein Q6363_003270 [Candidatus Njordarchaeota archaeon]